jgi:hypothetical protein
MPKLSVISYANQRPWIGATVLLAMLALAGCDHLKDFGGKDPKESLILSQTREIGPGAIWDREFNGSRRGTLRIAVSGATPFSVTLVADPVYQLMVKENKRPADFDSGVYVNSKCDGEFFETVCKLEPGKYWISIVNNSPDAATFRLQCHSW